jgi:rhodanese-related sulfurtransferase
MNSKIVKGATITVVGIFVAVVVSFSLSTTNTTANHNVIPPKVAKQLIDEGSVDLILDVRTPQEYTGPYGRLENSKLIPIQELESRISEIADYKEKTVLVYCLGGVRSSNSTKILSAQGFTKVLDLQGGISQWLKDGLKTLK